MQMARVRLVDGIGCLAESLTLGDSVFWTERDNYKTLHAQVRDGLRTLYVVGNFVLSYRILVSVPRMQGWIASH